MSAEPAPDDTDLAAAAPAGLFAVSPDGAILAVNPAFEALAGQDRAALLGRSLRDLLTRGSQVIYALKVERPLLDGGEVEEILVELARPEGPSRPVLLTLRPSGPDRRHGVLFSAPERRAYEHELVAARRAAEQAAEARSRFLANMSHELRTPLNGILGFAYLIEHAARPAQHQEYARLIGESARELEALVGDILDFASLERGDAAFQSVPVDVAAVVGEVCDQSRQAAAAKGLTLAFEAAPDAEGEFLGDPVRLRQIARALVGNAVKFTLKGGVTVHLSMAVGGLRLSVVDTGVGFDPADAERLFAPFQQADSSTTRRFGGAGLGLSTVRGVLDRMGGAIRAESAPGLGSRFEVDLPLARALAVAPPPAAAEPPRPDALRVLCAEDNLANQFVLRSILEHLGHEVEIVGDGAAALDRLAAGPYDLVLMDMQMPGMDGLAATRALREREAASGEAPVPVIMVTANAMPDHVIDALKAGADLHVPKPVTAMSIEDAIDETFRLAPRQALQA